MSNKGVTLTLTGGIFRFAILAAVVIFVFRASVFAYDFGYRIFAEEPVSEAPGLDVSIAITDDMSIKDISKMLESQGLIQDAKLFRVQEMVSEYKDKIVPGAYTLNTSMTAEQMLEVMGSGYEEDTTEEAGAEGPDEEPAEEPADVTDTDTADTTEEE